MLCLELGQSIQLTYDYIIIGSGSSGSIVASRLADNGSSVLVLEAGGGSSFALGNRDVVATQGNMGANGAYTPTSVYTKYEVPLYWSSSYLTGPNWDIAGAGVAKVTGGCGNHNGMVFNRGTSTDYDGWNVNGWNAASMLPYFIKSETILDPPLAASTLHGHSGPINVGTHPFDSEGADFISSCNAAGLPFNADFQNDTRDGCGYFQFNIDPNGIRSSPFEKYLKPKLNKPNLTLLTGIHVLRINFIQPILNPTPIASSVLAHNVSTGVSTTFTALKEVILAAGALNTPKILLNSGVGDASYLATYSSKIPYVYSNRTGVGKNLQNHFLALTVWSYNATSNRPTFYDMFSQSLLFQTGGGGILGTPGFSVGAWLRPNASATGVSENVMLILPGVLGSSTPFQSMSVGVSISQPAPNNHSIVLGSNTALSAVDFYLQAPKLNFNMFSNQADVDTIVRGIMETRRIMSFPPMNNRATPVNPPSTLSTSELGDWVRNSSIAHQHWCGTAKMGNTNDPTAVVDSRLKVIGVNNLRIVDASIIPTIPNSLMHATVIAIAEKAADLIIQDKYS
ncbi:hypothetical protein SAMD00019534_027160 [Acytostelium subglobosum LB1]|uniref:hypothetical protein n=1 Tax=Acytostelium subglobosum LB1 TaxID=1410327 RepID=UPI000644D1A2|nr:hypothetical protein SAMD00019534_027160 [Acytostelium subglobosum LB1]GAM19541.1 hypothetical protein SAMD00019534_027160 [Acytostelium subglobosum LB1]|eukprot:XP_012757468.1 hypothetical protein SAMD00019534_027160 [Acytostelium subglobosum LB1]